ncbi:hypothetical protein BB558_006185 [Smittium angustum]|uniref:Arrestin-like N-terminal domain-containing protein n=1 Tax=Smittium angustum TaxID=133377 RepID=A0A2U1IYG4_SMIAN|nr:hypothetical protein BB558_006185 [Smittium angustum]
MDERLQARSSKAPIMLHQVPKILKQYSWKIPEQLPNYISLYQKDNLKIVLMLQTRYLHSTKNYSPIKATLYIDYKPNQDDEKIEISCKEITLTLTEEYSFLKKIPEMSYLDKNILGKKKYDFENLKNNTETIGDTEEHRSSYVSLSPPSYNFSSSIHTQPHSQSLSTNSSIFKTSPDSINGDKTHEVSYELYLPQFDKEPQSSYISENLSIFQYLECKATIGFKNLENKKGSIPENYETTKEKSFSTKSIIYAIPEQTKEYIYSLPTYQDINKNHLYHCESTDMGGFIQNEIDILAS